MDAVEEIKQRLNIEDVVSEYVELKRSGRNFKGLSPFANERTPSFMVSPEKQIWHDFSSGKGGNMFSFVMEMEGLDFKGALELLARKAGIDLEQFRGSGSGARSKYKERLYEALELATKFYQVQFTKNREALEYVFRKRQFTKQTVLEWRLGYSPNTGTAVVDFLKSKGFNEREIKDAGLSAQRYRGLGDMFRGRFMIPLCDPQGRVIGFTARLLQDDPNAPKYINTPQTPLYDKSRHVFGLHLAKDAIRKSKFVVIAEGNLDVISSHQADVRQVVATAGTALTEPHLKTLGRFTGDIRLSFDADNAGLNATERSIPVASKVNVSLSIISIPSGKDPDELIKQDVAIWKDVITKPQYAVDWLIDRYSKQLDITTAQGKKQFSDVVLAVVRQLSDHVEQDHYMEHIAGLIGVSREALEAKFDQEKAAAKPSLKTPKVPQEKIDKQTVDRIKRQRHLLALIFFMQGLRHLMEPLAADMFEEPMGKETLAFLKEHPDFDGTNASPDRLKPIADYVKILQLLFEESYQNLDDQQMQEFATKLRSHLIAEYVKMQKPPISKKLDEVLSGEPVDYEAAKALNDQLKYLDTLNNI